MTRLGIVLAAGEATRLPGKLLLPQICGWPIILSSVTYCFRWCHHVNVIVREGSLEGAWLECTMPKPAITTQPFGLELMQRLKELQPLIGHFDETLITFGDNIYRSDEEPVAGKASVRAYVGPNADELDGFDCSAWLGRNHKPTLKLAGWVCLQKVQVGKFLGQEVLLAGMAEAEVKPDIRPAAGWYDIGTPEAYKWYLERESSPKECVIESSPEVPVKSHGMGQEGVQMEETGNPTLSTLD